MKIHDHEQNTPEWMAARLGKPTASSASKLVTSTGAESKSMEAYAEKLACDLFAGKDIEAWEGNAYTERGHEIEPEARSWLEFERNIDIQEFGFCTDDDERYGCSPDGVIASDGGLVEIKCLPKGHLKALLYWNKNGKAPAEYLPQVHMQMLVMNAPYCLLTYYHSDLPRVVIEIERDPAFDAALITQINACIEHRDHTLATLQGMAA